MKYSGQPGVEILDVDQHDRLGCCKVARFDPCSRGFDWSKSVRNHRRS
jgi:hypothetical protein